MLNRLYRVLLILLLAAVGGLVLYAVLPDLTPHLGETGAALWSWFLILASGISAHYFLPVTDLSPVSRVLLAILASVAAAVLCAGVIVLLVDFPAEDGGLGTLMLVALATVVFACLVFFPIHILSRRMRNPLTAIFVFSGAIVPAAWILLFEPFGDDEFLAILIMGLVFALIGAVAGWTFSIVAGRNAKEEVGES